MRTSDQIQADITTCTDSTKFDQLTAELHKAEKTASIQAAQERQDALEGSAEIRRQRAAEYEAKKAQAQTMFTELRTTDDQILEAVNDFIDLVGQRFEMGESAAALEIELQSECKKYGDIYQPHPTALMYGQNIRPDFAYLERVWLQRVTDWRYRLQRWPTAEEINSHGFRGYGGNDDHVTRDGNF